MWIARDKDWCSQLHIFKDKPVLHDNRISKRNNPILDSYIEPTEWWWREPNGENGHFIPDDFAPEVTFENSPIEIKLEMTKTKQPNMNIGYYKVTLKSGFKTLSYYNGEDFIDKDNEIIGPIINVEPYKED